MNWKRLEHFDLPDWVPVFWRYDFADGDVRYYCHGYDMVKSDLKTKCMGPIAAIYFVNPEEIKL